jgi:hypothetical protein
MLFYNFFQSILLYPFLNKKVFKFVLEVKLKLYNFKIIYILIFTNSLLKIMKIEKTYPEILLNFLK